MSMIGQSVQAKRVPVSVLDFSDEITLDSDIVSENTLDLEFRKRRMPTVYDTERLKDIKSRLGIEEPEPVKRLGLNLDIKKTDEPFHVTFGFKKRIAYLVDHKNLLALDVDIRSIDGIKFFGFRPQYTHQLDAKTRLRTGMTVLPGSVLFLLGATKQLSEQV